MNEALGSLEVQVHRFFVKEVAPVLCIRAEDMEVIGVEDQVARIRLQGSCGCCPASVMTVLMGMEAELRRQVPGIEYLEVVP